MPVGEDIPILIPVSIVLVVFILSLFALYTNFSGQTEIVDMSQKSLNIAEYLIKNIENGEMELINECLDLEELGIKTNYNVYINLTKLETNEWNCWGNIKDSDVVITNSLPLLIDGDLSKVVVSVGK